MSRETRKSSRTRQRRTGDESWSRCTGPRSAPIGFRLDPDVDEFEAVGAERANCEVVRAPRIKGAPIALECVVDRIFAVGDLNNHVVWANVVRFHVRDEVLLENGRVDIGAPYR
jgi:flavin reductase (DIM6/NTAB) family NADH-FMN oxidoreductase RutF